MLTASCLCIVSLLNLHNSKRQLNALHRWYRLPLAVSSRLVNTRINPITATCNSRLSGSLDFCMYNLNSIQASFFHALIKSDTAWKEELWWRWVAKWHADKTALEGRIKYITCLIWANICAEALRWVLLCDLPELLFCLIHMDKYIKNLNNEQKTAHACQRERWQTVACRNLGFFLS